jgi:hypothetical protein
MFCKLRTRTASERLLSLFASNIDPNLLTWIYIIGEDNYWWIFIWTESLWTNNLYNEIAVNGPEALAAQNMKKTGVNW